MRSYSVVFQQLTSFLTKNSVCNQKEYFKHSVKGSYNKLFVGIIPSDWLYVTKTIGYWSLLSMLLLNV